MNRKPKPFDTVSSATLRDSDLLDAMLGVLEYYRPRKYADVIKQGRAAQEKFGNDFGYIGYLLSEGHADTKATEEQADELQWLICETLYDCMNEIAPAGCSYGSHPGDGALFGFWPDEDSDLWE